MAQQVEPHILKKFQILQKLGKGAYGVVWKAVDKQTKNVVAVKKVFDAFQNATDAQRTFRQVIFLRQLYGHPHVVGLQELIKAENNKDIYLVFDFMETDLHAVVRAKILENIHKKYVLYQILKGLKYMHSGGLVHRDLKPSNILLDSDCLAKLADFGLARSVASINQGSGEAIMTQYVATRWYRAPQILLGSSNYMKAVDMWSVGCILGEMYTGKSIFPGSSTLNQIQRILQLLGKPTQKDIDSMSSVMAKECLNQINIGRKKSFSTFFGNIDNEALDLISKLLVFNPNQRLTAEQALQHPYLRDFHDISQQIIYPGAIQIPIDDNKKFSIKQYRQALYKEISKRNIRKDKSFGDETMNTSVLSTQDSNNNPNKKPKREDKNRDKRNYTEYINRNMVCNNKREEISSKQKSSMLKRQSSYKKRQLSKQNNCSAYQTKELRSSLSKQKSNLIRPTQKPLNQNKGYMGQRDIKYIDKGSLNPSYFRKR